jgi:hypothetical protein
MIKETIGEDEVVILTPAQSVTTISGIGPKNVIRAYFHHFIHEMKAIMTRTEAIIVGGRISKLLTAQRAS